MGHFTGKLYRAGLGRVSNDTLTVRGTNGFVLYGRGKDVTPCLLNYIELHGFLPTPKFGVERLFFVVARSCYASKLLEFWDKGAIAR